MDAIAAQNATATIEIVVTRADGTVEPMILVEAQVMEQED